MTVDLQSHFFDRLQYLPEFFIKLKRIVIDKPKVWSWSQSQWLPVHH